VKQAAHVRSTSATPSDAAPRAVACFTFDNMGEAAEIGAGTLDGPRPPGTDRALAEGHPRLLDLLDAHGVRASFFVEGWNGEHHPDAVREIVARGHELGMHGWLHETWHALDPQHERALAGRATAALHDAAGVAPRGFRAPGGARSAATEGILRELGYAFDASIGDGMRPGRLAGGLAQVPFVWPGVDGFHYLRDVPAPPADVEARWLATLDRTAEQGGLFLLICHPHITGLDRARVAALGAVMARAVRDPRVAVRTAGEVAAALAPVV
jgi:peptidoglycan/xylan/chitin deacetylase (PgdA/CDA1 family)